MSHRLFVALRPPSEIRTRLLSVMAGIDGARWQEEGQLHLTLAFLGSLDGDLAEAVADALHHVSAPALDLSLGLFGTFPAAVPGLVGTLWIDVQPHAPLAALAARIRRRCQMAGVHLPRERFRPHITLARFRGGGATREQLAPFLRSVGPPPGSWHESRFHLVESFPGKAGAHHEPAVSYRLTEPPTKTTVDRHRP